MFLENEKIFYVHIPRSGGSSVELAFGFKKSNEVEYRHRSIKQIRSALRAEGKDINDFKIITTVRNIFDRLISTYRYREVIARNNNISLKELTFEEYTNVIHNVLTTQGKVLFYKDPQCSKEAVEYEIANEQSRYHNYYKGMNGDFIFSMSHVRPLSNWLDDFSESEEIIYIDFNDYKNDFDEKVVKSFDFMVNGLTHHNKTPNWANIDADYTEDMKNKVYEIYEWEIEKFGMSFL